MIRKILFIIGELLFVLGIAGFIYLTKGEQDAKSRYQDKKSHGIISGEFLPCEWNAQTPEKILSESQTQAILVNVNNKLGEKCVSLITLRAPGFDITPLKESQELSLDASGSGSISWIITPKKPGTYDIAVTDDINTKIFGISVTNTFGLNAIQAKTLSVIGSLFGPMFTIPWWWDRLRKKKE